MTSWPVNVASQNNEAPPAVAICEYYCHNGAWRLVLSTGGPGFDCKDTLDNPCTEGTFMSIPAVPIQNKVAKLPENTGEYVYSKGMSHIRLLRGGCQPGLHLKSQIALDDVPALSRQAASLIASIQNNDSVSSMHVLIPAQNS